MSDAELRAAHRHSTHHRTEVLASRFCRCFYCLAVFAPSEILEWVDEDAAGIGQTALCPRCGIDSVIGSSAGVPLEEPFLQRMHEFWF